MSDTDTNSSIYTLSYLSINPISKDVVYKHLQPLLEQNLIQPELVHATLRDMFDNNMGGGIPYEIIVPLMDELDTLKIS